MADFINREKVLAYLNDIRLTVAPDDRTPPEDKACRIAEWSGITTAMDAIAAMPAADGAVITCKDCRYYHDASVNSKGFMICPASGMEITPNDFCSYAED